MSTTATRHNLAVAAHEHALTCGDPLDVLRAVAPAIGAPTMTTAEVVAALMAATSADRVARECDVSRSTVYSWGNDRAQPDAAELAALRRLALHLARHLIGAAVSEPTPRARREVQP